MRTKGYIKVVEISNQELADFLETTCYGSDFGTDWDENDYAKIPMEQKTEDFGYNQCADILKYGGSIEVTDWDGNGEHYGSLPHRKTESYVAYTITLEDVRSGIERALNGTYKVSGSVECMNVKASANRVIEGEDYDQYDAQLVMQVILFDEIIYG